MNSRAIALTIISRSCLIKNKKKIGQLAFSESQPQLVNTDKKNPFPIIFGNLYFQLKNDIGTDQTVLGFYKFPYE